MRPLLPALLLLCGCVSHFVDAELTYARDAARGEDAAPPLDAAPLKDTPQLSDAPLEVDAQPLCGAVRCGLGVCANEICVCDEGATYDAENRCVPEPCDEDGECPEGWACREGACHALDDLCAQCRADQGCVEGECRCPAGAEEQDGACVVIDPCGGCSGRGECVTHVIEGEPVASICACDAGYTPPSAAGLSCVSTGTRCRGGRLPGLQAQFEPVEAECLLYEGLNRIRALTDEGASGLCFEPLDYSRAWSQHARGVLEAVEAGALDLGAGERPEGAPGGGAYLLFGRGDPPQHLDALSQQGPCPSPRDGLCQLLTCGFSEIGVGRSASGKSMVVLVP